MTGSTPETTLAQTTVTAQTKPELPGQSQFRTECRALYARLQIKNPEYGKLSNEQRDKLRTAFVQQLEVQLQQGDDTVDYSHMTTRLHAIQDIRREWAYQMDLPSGYPKSDTNNPYDKVLRSIDYRFKDKTGRFDTATFGGWAFVEAFSRSGGNTFDNLLGVCYIIDRVHPELVTDGYLTKMAEFQTIITQDPDLTVFTSFTDRLTQLESTQRDYAPRSLGGMTADYVQKYAENFRHTSQVDIPQGTLDIAPPKKYVELLRIRTQAVELAKIFGVRLTMVEGDTFETANTKLLNMQSAAELKASALCRTKDLGYNRFDPNQSENGRAVMLPLETRLNNARHIIGEHIKKLGTQLPRKDHTGQPLSDLDRILAYINRGTPQPASPQLATALR